MYITLDPDNGGFTLSESQTKQPSTRWLNMSGGEGLGLNQGDLFNWRRRAGIGPKKKASFIAMLNRERTFVDHSQGLKGAKHYEPVS